MRSISILDWASHQGRIVVTHDRNKMTGHAYERIKAGAAMSGLFVVSREMPVGDAIHELEILVSCSQMDEWN